VKSEPGPPMTLGAAAAAGVHLIVWCWDCSHQENVVAKVSRLSFFVFPAVRFALL
jgi:hypothetical protein